MVLYYNEVCQVARNAYYPHMMEINSPEDLEQVVRYDHVCAAYRDSYRKNDNFISADCNMFDVDNTDSDDAAEWITPETVRKAFPDVPFYVSYSRNHMKQKGDKAPRPKFHIYFPDVVYNDMAVYRAIKEGVCSYFTAFDPNAKDAARFFFGVEQPKVEFYPGSTLLSNFMKQIPEESTGKGTVKERYAKKATEISAKSSTGIIPKGQRNSTLHKYALSVLTRFGNQSDKAHQSYIEESKKCSPLLGENEVNSIWNSAVKYYESTIKASPGYISPEQYSRNISLKPREFTDVGQADIFARMYCKKVRYSPATNYLFFTGQAWQESDLKARGLAQELVVKQRNEACAQLKKAQENENSAVLDGNKDNETAAKVEIKQAKHYRKFAIDGQHTLRISATLKEAQPMLEVDVSQLDSNGFILNTPSGTVDLKTRELKPHDPDDFCTKITSIGPSAEGKELFHDFLNEITCGDRYLAEYLHYIAGMIAVGKVFCENLIIAYGCGCNGKSTFFNLLSRCLGSYAGSLSSDILTANCRRNKNPEYAELRGKRLAIAAELEDGMRLDTSIVKKLCSTDPISAEKKYKDPFSFIPTHTVVLYTNHLPTVSVLDPGTWRRLVVVPFNAVISPNNEVKNYADYLYEAAGGAVISWLIEGAYKFIAAGYKIEQPEAVEQAISMYRAENDWIGNYVEERCEVDKSFCQPSGELYKDYSEYSKSIGEPPHTNAAFNKALEEKGFFKKKNSRGSFIYGLRLLPQSPPYEFPKISTAKVMDYDGEIEESSEDDVEF